MTGTRFHTPNGLSSAALAAGLASRRLTTLSDLAKPITPTPYDAANYSTPPAIGTVAPVGLTRFDYTSGFFHFSGVPNPYAANLCFFKTSPYANAPYCAAETVVGGQRAVICVAPLANQLVQVLVDDQPVWAQPQAVTNVLTYIDLQFTTRSTRNIRVLMSGNGVFGGVYVPTFEQIALPQRRFRVGLYGDSYAYHQNDVTLESPCYVLTMLTGFDWHEMGQGATGYVADASGANGRAPYAQAARIQYLTDLDIDHLVVLGSVNDWLQTPAAVGAAATAFYGALAAARPKMGVTVAGVEPMIPQGQVQPGSYATINAAIKTAAQAASNVVQFVDWFTEDWLTGNGSTAVPAGNGNQDVYVGTDGLHMNVPGTAYLYRRLWAAVANSNLARST